MQAAIEGTAAPVLLAYETSLSLALSTQELQQRLPMARVLYASATGVSEVRTARL